MTHFRRISDGTRLRRTHTVMLLSLILTMVSSAAVAQDQPDDTDILVEQIQPFVFGGEDAVNPGWVTAVLDSGFLACTGSLIHQQWVLTAAHCVDGAGTYSVAVGGSQWGTGLFRQVSQVRIHPGYIGDIGPAVDLAMLKLSSPVTGVPVATLPQQTDWPVFLQEVSVYGWGETYTNSPPPSNLQRGDVVIDSDSSGTIHASLCPPEWVGASNFDDFCFGGYSWACSGDSGGPLVGFRTPSVSTGPRDTLYGVVSYGEATGCSDTNVDSVAQATGPHVNWITGFYASAPGPSVGDESFFYRSTDGAYRYYDMKPNGSLGTLLNGGTGYSKGWDSITAIDLDG